MIKNNQIMILGTGLSGMGSLKLANKMGINVFISDSKKISSETKKHFYKNDIEFEENGHNNNKLTESKEVIISPGISFRNLKKLYPEINKKKFISEIEFASRYTDAYIIAVTGSNGKTTTANLIYHILKSNGLNVGLAGNIGVSFASSVCDYSYDYYIIEISSFQLDNVRKFKPDISIVLNIDNDHLDRYDNDINNYVQSKLKIQMNQTEKEKFIYLSEDSNISPYLSTIKAEKYSFGKTNILPLQKGAWIHDNTIIINTIKNNFTMTIHNLALQGTHNIYNSMAASIAASTLGIKNEIIKKSLTDFKGVEHRLEFVGQVSGVKYINDSKATNCNAVYYALDSISSPIIWICGGVDKGNNYAVLKDLVANKVKSIICLGENNKMIQSNFKSVVSNILVVNSMEEAVSCSHSNADVGDTVLLSPACASFDLFKNYEERGQMFKSCVSKI